MTTFADRFVDRARTLDTPCVVGLDPNLELMPQEFLSEAGIDGSSDMAACADALYAYNVRVLDAIHDLVPAVKPQAAYYEQYGSHGFAALERTMVAARERGLLVILDVKRGDIASTATAYARAYLAGEPKRGCEADAMTVAPYLGDDSLVPFFEAALEWGKGVFVLAKTSNPGGAELQDREVGDRRVYELVADWVAPWAEKSRGESGRSSLGIVVGATAPEAATRLRARLPHSLFLVPGIGAQGAALDALRACFDADGEGALINNARSIMYPHRYGSETSDVAAIRAAATKFIAEVRDATAS